MASFLFDLEMYLKCNESWSNLQSSHPGLYCQQINHCVNAATYLHMLHGFQLTVGSVTTKLTSVYQHRKPLNYFLTGRLLVPSLSASHCPHPCHRPSKPWPGTSPSSEGKAGSCERSAPSGSMKFAGDFGPGQTKISLRPFNFCRQWLLILPYATSRSR